MDSVILVLFTLIDYIFFLSEELKAPQGHLQVKLVPQTAGQPPEAHHSSLEPQQIDQQETLQ